jgi:hypothetical protein
MDNIYIPDKIKIGFQNRSDTYTKKLGYVIYYDNKGKIRKETSWNSWRDKEIDPLEFQNEPTNGFVLNKKAGGYSTGWNHRQTYSRIFDPRGFEFEITIQNLLYILENTDCLKGKGLSGEFVYGWDSGDLLLIPTAAPEYGKMENYSRLLEERGVKAKDLVLGGTYLSNKSQNLVYLGKFDAWSDFHSWNGSEPQKALGKKFFFHDGTSVVTRSSISGTLIQCVSDQPAENYADLMDVLQCNAMLTTAP